MQFNVFSELEYQVNELTTFVFNIKALKAPHQYIVSESLIIDPFIPYEEFASAIGEARLIRITAPENSRFKISYQGVVDVYHQVIYTDLLPSNTDFHTLDPAYFQFVNPSRYVESDKLVNLAQREFGKLDTTYAQVLAISDWIYNSVEYLSGSTHGSTSAFDTVTERAGVCRDFSHLAIALCRALDIPARYFTGYAHELDPPDFHACFEAYIGGFWLFFDPTRLAPVNGLVKIANGRDATDVAVANIYGDAENISMNVSCVAADKSFIPDNNHSNKKQGLAYQAMV